MSEFRDAIYTRFTDEEGLVSVVPNPGHWSTGNGLLYTGIFYVLLALRGELEEIDKTCFEAAVRNCYVSPSIPVLNRNRGRPDLESADDYRGVCAAAFFLNSNIAKEICDYGECKKFSFNNVELGKFTLRTWFGRFPGFPGHLRLCAKKQPGRIQALELSCVFRFGCTGKPSDDIQNWLMVVVAKHATGQFIEQVKIWEQSLSETYGGLKGLFAKYFSPEHPFVIYT